MTTIRRKAGPGIRAAFCAVALLFGTSSASIAAKYDPGASDTEIKIGQTTAYSGPFASWSLAQKVQAAYFKMINEHGGINGRKINLISRDDSYSPPKTVEQTRRLVEDDGVLFMFASLGTAPNSAVQKYLNAKRIPQLFVQSGASKWADPRNFPWTMGWLPSYANEGAIYAHYIIAKMPDAKVSLLYQNDDLGKDYVRGFEKGLGGENAGMIVARTSYLATDPTVDSQIITLQASGANVLFMAGAPKFAAQAINKMDAIGWHPTYFLSSTGAQVESAFKVVGLEKAAGVISTAYMKDPGDPAMKGDAGVEAYKAFMAKYGEGIVSEDINAVWGYSTAETLVQVLRQCGDDLTRESIMRQAANLHGLEVGMLMPGIKINTSATDFSPIKEEALIKFDGKKWERLGENVEN